MPNPHQIKHQLFRELERFAIRMDYSFGDSAMLRSPRSCDLWHPAPEASKGQLPSLHLPSHQDAGILTISRDDGCLMSHKTQEIPGTDASISSILTCLHGKLDFLVQDDETGTPELR